MNGCPPDEGRYCLTLACRSARGQVAAVTALLERHGAYIEEFAVFDDVPSERFYVRTVFRIRGATATDLDALSSDSGPCGPRRGRTASSRHGRGSRPSNRRVLDWIFACPTTRAARRAC